MAAIRHNSYFSISVEPGEHHMCATPGPVIALAHFNAEAGKVYYFRTRVFGSNTQSLFDFDPIDSDHAQYLIASYPLSVFAPKSVSNKKLLSETRNRALIERDSVIPCYGLDLAKFNIQFVPNWSVNMAKRAAHGVSCGACLISPFSLRAENNLSVSCTDSHCIQTK